MPYTPLDNCIDPFTNLTEPYCRVVEQSLCKLGRALAGGHLPTIAKLVLAHEGIREHVLLKVFDLVDAECGKLCQRSGNPPSLFRKIPVDKLPRFQWGPCIEELEVKAPTLLRMLATSLAEMITAISTNREHDTIQGFVRQSQHS